MDHNHLAMGILRSWLDACQIPHQTNEGSVFIKGNPVLLDKNSTEALISTNLDESLKVFHNITESNGFGRPLPVDRGPAPDKKVYDDPVLPRIRHTEFRTAPNNEKALRLWMPHINRLSRSFYSKNYNFLKAMGYEVEDIKTYFMVWTTTFVHRYLLDKDGDDNIKLLTLHLRQRFGELYRSLQREKKNSLPDHESAAMNQGDFYDSDEAPDEAWREAHDEIKIKSPTPRKRKAAEMLNSKLAAMPHEKMVVVLDYTITHHPCPETRKMAIKKLAEHRASCQECR